MDYQRIEELEQENQALKAKLDHIQSLSKQKNKRRLGILKFIGGAVAGRKLKRSIYNVLEEYNTQKHVSRATFSDFLASLIQRITRIGVVTILFAVLPSILLIQQNILIKKQNKKIQDQTFLAESSRRSSYMFIMGDLMSDLNDERKQSSALSTPLQARIISLSKAIKPYRYLGNNDEIIPKPISPERGQLLIVLSKSGIAKHDLLELYDECDFSYAEILNGNLSNAFLKDLDLRNANLSNSDLENVDLTYTLLNNAELVNTDFTDAVLKQANFTNANLSNANLRFATLNGANFTDANLDNVKVHRMDWLDYIKTKKVKGADELRDDYEVDSVYTSDLRMKVPTLIKK